MQREIWVPMLGNGQPMNPFRPDVPDSVRWTTDEGAPTDLTADDGRPAVTKFNLIVDEKSILVIREHLQAKGKDIINYDDYANGKLLVGMIRACRGDYGGRAAVFFDAISDIANAGTARKADIKRVLLQAVARGLSPNKAEEISARHNLPAGNKYNNAAVILNETKDLREMVTALVEKITDE